MVKESSLETTPGLIALIDNPSEEDLLKVIYSDNVTSDIIKELPDKSITPMDIKYSIDYVGDYVLLIYKK